RNQLGGGGRLKRSDARAAMLHDRRPAAARKQQIVETALELVAEHGADAVSAQRIADTIGLSQPAVFRHFPTKEAVWMAGIAWLQDRLVDGWVQCPGGHAAARPPSGVGPMSFAHVGVVRV